MSGRGSSRRHPAGASPKRSRRAKAALLFGVLPALLLAGAVLFLWPTGEQPAEHGSGERFPEGPTGLARLQGTGGQTPWTAEADAEQSRIVGVVRRGGCGVEAHVEVRRVDASVWRPSEEYDALAPRPSVRDLLPDLPAAARVETVRTDAQGRFRIAVPGCGGFEVSARREDGLVARRHVTVPAVGSEARVVLELPSGAEELAGWVEYEDGRPFVGVVLMERGPSARIPWGGHLSPCWTVSTNGEGRFRIAGLPEGALTLSVVDPGELRLANVPVTLPQEGELRILVPSRTSCRGRIVDAASHAPVAGAQVTVVGYAWTGSTVLVHTSTDVQGRFDVAGPVLQVSVSVEARGYAPTTRNWPQVTTKVVTVGLQRGASVRGRVVTHGAGSAVPGIAVMALPFEWDPPRTCNWFFPPPRHFAPKFLAHTVHSDHEGRFAFQDLPEGPVFVCAWDRGWSSLAFKPGEEAASSSTYSLESGEVLEVELAVRPTAGLHGRVCDAMGGPVSGAEVRVLTHDAPDEEMLEDLGDEGVGLYRTVTRGDGSFLFDAILPYRTIEVRVVSPDYLPALAIVDPLAGGHQGELEIRLQPGRWLDVTVVSAQGRALGEAVVEQDPNDTREMWGPPGRTWVADDAGRTRAGPFALDPLRLRAHRPDCVQSGSALPDAWTTIPGASGDGDSTRITLVVEEGAPLAGRVTGPPGAPLERVALTADPYEWPRHVPLTPVASDGSWTVAGRPGANFTSVYAVLEWQGRIYVGTLTARPGSSENMLELSEVDDLEWSPRVRGDLRVLDQAGRPAALGQVMVHTRREDEPYCSLPLPLSPDGVPLSVWPSPPFWVEVWGVPGPQGGGGRFGPFERLDEELTVRLPASCTIEGRVLDADGRPVRGLAVTAHGGDACGDTDPARAVCFTDDLGRFALHDLGPIDYALRLDPPDDYERIPPTVTRGGATNVQIVLRPSTCADLTVLDPAGLPVRGCSLQATAATPGQHIRPVVCAWTDVCGLARLRGLDARTKYALQITPPERDEPLLPHVAEAWLPRVETIYLRRSLSIAGRVVDLAGRSFARARVRCWSEVSQVATSATSAEDGAFRFEGLAEGRCRVWADVGEVFSEKYTGSKVRDVEAGAEGVLVRLDRGDEITVHLEGWPEGLDVEAELHAEPPHFRWKQVIEADEERVFRFRGLTDAATYTLWIHPGWPASDRSRYVFLRHLRAGDEVRVPTERSEGLTGRLLFPLEVRIYSSSIWADVHGLRISGDQNTQHEFDIPGVPPGSYRMHARVSETDGTEWRGEAVASPGGPVNVTMEVVRR